MNESSRTISKSAAIPHAEANNFLAGPEALMWSWVRHLQDCIWKSSELSRAILTLGLTKLLPTQEIRLRLSFTVEIVETGSQSSELKTSST